MGKKRPPSSLLSLRVFWASFLGLALLSGMIIRYYFPNQQMTLGDLELAGKLLESGEMIVDFPLASERELKRHLIKIRSSASTLVLGSSRAQTVSAEILGVPWNSMINAGVSSATLEDLAAFWQVWKSTGRPIERVVVFLDNWMFNEENGLKQWKALSSDFESFQQGSDGMLYRAMVRFRDSENRWNELKAFWSADALKLALTSAGAEKKEPARETAMRKWPGAEGQRLGNQRIQPDGSHLFREELRNWDVGQVAREAYSEWGMQTGKVAYKRAAPELKSLAVRILADMKAYGAKRVQVFTSPYHPIAYQQVEHFAPDFEKTVAELSQAAGVEFIGTSNPSRIGCVEGEFYDGHHAKPECVKKIISMSKI